MKVATQTIISGPAAAETMNGNGEHMGNPRKYILVGGVQTIKGKTVERGNHEFTRDAIGALPPDSLYRRGLPSIPGRIVGESGEKHFEPATEFDARRLVDSSMKLASTREDREGVLQVVYKTCNNDNAGLILSAARDDARVRELKDIKSFPTFKTNWTLAPAGFSDGFYYDEPDELQELEPVRDSAEIRETLDDLVIDFPFARGDEKHPDADRQNFLGAILTPIIRPAINDNIPGVLISAPLERTGKTLLAEKVLGGVLIGRPLPATQLHRDNAEMDKRITATLLRGDPLVHFDNMHEFLDLPCLASLLTASVYQGRLLGKSLNIQAPNNAMFVLTGNSPQASGEMSKRLVPVCLQPANDSPELRTKFHHPDLSDYIQKNRRQILGCLVGMVLNWISAGKPPGQTTLGGFNKWASTVGGIMHLTGYKDWMGNAEAWRGKADTRKTDLRALVNEWFNKYGNADCTASDVLAIAVELEVFSNVWSKKEGKAAVTSFGKSVLARHVNTPIGDYRIERCGDSQPAKYCLKPLDRGEAP